EIMQPRDGAPPVAGRIPAVLTRAAAGPAGRTGAAAGFPGPGTGEEAAAAAAPDPWFSAPRFAAGPEPVLEPGPIAGPDVGRREAVPLLAAPLPSLAPPPPVADSGPAIAG